MTTKKCVSDRRLQYVLAAFRQMSPTEQTKFFRLIKAAAHDHDGRILKRIKATGIPAGAPGYLDAALAIIDEISRLH